VTPKDVRTMNIIIRCPSCAATGEVEVMKTDTCCIFMCVACPHIDFDHYWPTPEIENGYPADVQTAMVNRADG
jgi:Zn ribbon nucleic-acid-binding protein